MIHSRRTFRERDVKAAIKAVEAAGKQVAAVQISAQGAIRIEVGKPGEQESSANPWDEV
jgi:hypothetical protein